MIKAVVFDMDGVLIDSVEMGFRARKKILAQYGVDIDTIPDPQGEAHRAASLKSLLANIEKYSGVHIDHERFAKLSRDYMRQDLKESSISADQKLIDFLEDLKQNNIARAIVSSGSRKGVDIKLEMLDIKRYFSVIVTGDDVSEHKPNPAPYIYALKKLNLSAEDCVIFEDSQTGISAAKAAGCKVIGFTKYNSPHTQLDEAQVAIKDWDEISYNKLNTPELTQTPYKK